MPEDVTQWLEALGLGKYATTFAENDIDFRALPELSEQDLKELGVSLGHRRVLQRAISAFSESDDASSEPQASSDTSSPGAETHLAAWERHPGERKPVTLLFADIIGSTALTEKLDAEETHDLLYGATQRMCKAVENSRGTVCRFMGDGVMAIFGAPMASEHHAVEACEAAIAMQQAIEAYATDVEARYGCRLQIRVGLHSGEVVVLEVGEGDKVEYDASGPTVPIAARMEQAARPGEVFLTGATRGLAAERIETEPLEAVRVKGISEPMSVFALRRVRAADDVLPDAARTAFVGRRAELNQFNSLLAACVEEGYGQTIYLRGEPGIGKTRLVEEFRKLAISKGLSPHQGLVLPFGVGKGQDAIRSLLRSLLGIPPGSGKSERQRSVNRVLTDGYLEPDQTVFLNDLLDLPQPTELRALYDAMNNTTRNEGKRALVSSLMSTMSTMSTKRRVLAIVEDIHWADAITLAHLAALTKTVAECPAMLVMTSRINGDPLDRSWRTSTEGSPLITIDLGPLRKHDSIALISEFIDATDPLADSCRERAAGNPLFLEQLLRAAQEGSAASLPDSIQSLVLARMDRLEHGDKRALQTAAILGQRFDIDVLQDLLERKDYDCRALIEHYLVRPEGASYLFAHALIQESVYGSLLKRQRRQLHEKAAESFFGRDPVLHAQHLDHAEHSSAPRAYLEAARAESAAYRSERALELLERGLVIGGKGRDQYVLLCQLGELLRQLGQTQRSIETFERALTIAEDDIERCRAWLGLAAGKRITDEYEEALSLLAKAERAAIRHRLSLELSELHHLRGNLYFPMGDVKGCLNEHEAALKSARESGSVEHEAQALGGIGDAHYAAGRMLSAREDMKQCIKLCRQYGFGRIEVAYLPMLAEVELYVTADRKKCLADSLNAAEAAAQVKHQRAELLARQTACIVLVEMSELELAKEQLAKTRSLGRQLKARRFEPGNLNKEARILMAEGKKADALKRINDAIAIERETGAGFTGASTLGVLAEITDDAVLRLEALTEGEKVLLDGAVSYTHFDFYQSAIVASLNASDWDGMERYAAALESYTRSEPLPDTDFIVAWGRALAAFGRGQRDSSTMQELRRLHHEAERGSRNVALPALKEALSST